MAGEIELLPERALTHVVGHDPAGLVGRQSVFNRSALRTWYAALSNRNNAPAPVLFIGDSNTEIGWSPSYAKRWVSRVRDRLRERFPTPGVAGGFGYLAAYNAGQAAGANTPAGDPWTSITGGVPGVDVSWGLGNRSVVITSTKTITYSFTGTSFDLHYARGPATGTMTVSVDGGAATNVSTTGALTQLIYKSAALAAGAHTVTVGCTGNNIYFCGLFFYNGDEASGIHVYEGGHWGYKSQDFLSGGAGLSYWPTLLTTIQPALVVINEGTNDYKTQVPIETYKTNILTQIAAIRAKVPNASIILAKFSRRGDVSLPQPISWQDYINADYAIAAADTGGLDGGSGIAVVDLSVVMPNAALTGTADPLGIIHTDRVHFLEKGQNLIAEATLAAISP